MNGEHVEAVSMVTYQQEPNCSISLFISVERVGAKHRFKRDLFLYYFFFFGFHFLFRKSVIEFRIQEMLR